MKLTKLTLVLLLLIITTGLSWSQNMTVTLPTNGTFIIRDATDYYLALAQSDGVVYILSSLRLNPTGNSSTTGVIFKGGDRFIHDFKPAGANGCNTFIGLHSGNFSMIGTGTSSSFNTGVGYSSLTSLTTGYNNTAVGSMSLFNNKTGSYNTALGNGSLCKNITGDENTAVGCYSLYHNTTGFQNTAVGYASLLNNTSGQYNTAVGYQSLYNDTTGSYNTALGNGSLCKNITGDGNTAVGFNSLFSNTEGSSNTAVGFNSLYNTTGSSNTAVGFNSLFNNQTGDSNTSVGINSLLSNTEGSSNTAVGNNSLRNTTGSSNVAVGNNAGYTISSGYNLTCLGYNTQPTSGTATNQITLGNNQISNLRCNVTTITSLSDARDKKNIRDLNLGLDFLMNVKPRLFNWDRREWYDDNISDGNKIQKTPTAGFVAQELDEVQKTQNAEWLNLVLKDNPDKLEATPGNLLPIMVKAIQELKIENDELKEKLSKYEQMQSYLVSEIEKLKTKEGEVLKTSSK